MENLNIEIAKRKGYKLVKLSEWENDKSHIFIDGVVVLDPYGTPISYPCETEAEAWSHIKDYENNFELAFGLLESTKQKQWDKIQIETACKVSGEDEYRAAWIPVDAWTYPNAGDTQSIDWSEAIYAIDKSKSVACCKVWIDWFDAQKEKDKWLKETE